MYYSFFILAFVIVTYSFYRVYRYKKLDNSIRKILKKNPIIIDVRTTGEFKSGAFPKAINIPLGKLRTCSLKFEKEPIVVYCSHGLRSVKAKSILQNRGCTSVYNGGALQDLKKYL
ncbi:rhodanese-like domain-containing protein [Zunongwangia sp. HGR-M22]|uniref:rhodanese-like domain-containing protein n=1 Tax=Zunongwangia sp. HGR-M22 TaxID=3015168 RepID=UPI0022DE7DBA|nr:rhodanese-like domain-containing protein [Zunongwangia sp. HGR-M22]WBL24311.1 rhodanese-like domain-containing protein [Zunongwangia sp. HGR-M22]